jgi:type II pantothenate kinase
MAAAVLGESKGIDVPEEPGRHHRPQTSASNIDSTITHPGSVKINVQGAFIVDEDSSLADGTAKNGAHHETTNIRLPNHTAVVSHVAVDVRTCVSPKLFQTRRSNLC